MVERPPSTAAPSGPGPIRALVALFASAFTSQGLGSVLRAGWDLLSIACLTIGVFLCLLAAFWTPLSSRIISAKLTNSAIELGNDARWWGASVFILFMYFVFSPLFANLANIGEIGFKIYPLATYQSNRISWNFEDLQHPPFFFAFQKTNIQDTILLGFQAHGRNNSDKPINNISGFVRSNITNKELLVKFLVQGIPVAPDETNGIPPFAEFDIVTQDDIVRIVNGNILNNPLNIGEFSEFIFEFDYDGNKFVRTFTKQETQKQQDMFVQIASPDKSSIPRVTRKDKTVPIH
jgi:hypothetical protein